MQGNATMLAGMLIFAMASGGVAAGMAVAMSMPFWAVLGIYSLAGMIALLLAGAFVGIGGGTRQERPTLRHAGLVAFPLRARH